MSFSYIPFIYLCALEKSCSCMQLLTARTTPIFAQKQALKWLLWFFELRPLLQAAKNQRVAKNPQKAAAQRGPCYAATGPSLCCNRASVPWQKGPERRTMAAPLQASAVQEALKKRIRSGERAPQPRYLEKKFCPHYRKNGALIEQIEATELTFAKKH